MVRLLVDRFRRIELVLLSAGAVAASLLMVMVAGGKITALLDGDVPPLRAAMYGLKLLLMEAALLAPFLVLALLGRALQREAPKRHFRWAGVAISLLASAGVAVILLGGFLPANLEAAKYTLVAGVVPALVLLSACALLYGGLIRLAQHAKAEPIRPSIGPPRHRARH